MYVASRVTVHRTMLLYAITLLLNRRLGVKKAALDPSKLDG